MQFPMYDRSAFHCHRCEVQVAVLLLAVTVTVAMRAAKMHMRVPTFNI